MVKYQFMGPGTTGFSSASSCYNAHSTPVSGFCLQEEMYETVPERNCCSSMHKGSRLNCLVKNSIEAKSLMRQLPHLLQKLVDNL